MTAVRKALPHGVVPEQLVAALDEEIARSPGLARMTGKRKPRYEVRLAIRLAELLIVTSELIEAIAQGRRRLALFEGERNRSEPGALEPGDRVGAEPAVA